MASIGTVEGYLKLTDDFTTVLDRAMGALQKSTGMMATNLQQMQTALDTTAAAAKRMGVAAKQAGHDAETGAKKAKASSSMLHDLRAAYALAAIGIWQFIDRTVAAQQASDRMRNSLLAGTGDIRIVGQELAFVREESNRLGLDLASAGVQYGKLTAASKGTGVEMKTVRATFTAVAEAATALGLSSEDTTGALNAIVQMMTKGTVQAEELRGQLGDRVPGAVQAMARALGVGNDKMMEMLEQGKVITADVLPRFAEELAKIGGSGVEAGMTSFNAELNRLKTSLFDLFAGIAGDVSLPNFIRGMREFVEIVDDLIRNGGGKQVFEDLSAAIGAAFGGLGNLIRLYSMLNGLAEKAKSSTSGPNLTPLGFAVDALQRLGLAYDESKAAVLDWVSSTSSAVSSAKAGVFSLVGSYQGMASEAEKFFAEVAASGRALTSEDLLAFANSQNKKNLAEMQDRLKKMTKESLAFQKANSAAFDLEDKLKNQAKELEIFQKLLKENGGDFELAKRNAASYYAVLKAGLDPLKGQGKVLYDLAIANDAIEESLKDGKKAMEDEERAAKKLAAAIQKDLVDAHKKALKETEALEKWFTDTGEAMSRFATEVGNYWGSIEAASNGADALREFNKEAEIQAKILAVLGDRTAEMGPLYDIYAQEIRDSLGPMIDHRNEIEKTLEMYEGMSDVLNNTDWGSDKMNALAGGLGQVMSAMGKLRTATKLFSKETADAWAGMLQGINAVLEASGAFQTGNGGGFGGTSEGNYAAEGQMVGAIIGGIIGAFVGAPQAGMAIGAAAGGILGGFIKKGAEEALGSLTINTSGFYTELDKAEGDLATSFQGLGRGIGTALMDIVASIGGEIGSMPEVEMKIRDGVIGVVINGVKGKFKEMDDAISFAVTELLKQGDILGIDDMLRDALGNTSASSLEGLSRDLEAVMKVLSFGMTNSERDILSFTNEIDALRVQMFRLLKGSDQLSKALANLNAEEINRWQSSRDALTGDKKSNAEKLEILKRDAAMWNAEKALRVAELQSKLASLMAARDALVIHEQLARERRRIDYGSVDAEFGILRTRADLGETEMQMFGLQAQGMLSIMGASSAAAAEIVSASMALLNAQIEATGALIAALGNMPDIDIPSLHLPNAGGGSGSSGPSEAEQRAQSLADFINTQMLDGMSEMERALYELNAAFDEQRQAAEEAGKTAELEALRTAAIARMRQEFLDGIMSGGLSDYQNQLQELNDSFAEQALLSADLVGGEEDLAEARRVALGQLREELLDGFGTPLEQLRDRISEFLQRLQDVNAANAELNEQLKNGEISLREYRDAIAHSDEVVQDFIMGLKSELLNLALYFTDAMGDTQASAAIRKQLAILEWQYKKLELRMMIEAIRLAGGFGEAAGNAITTMFAAIAAGVGNIVEAAAAIIDPDYRGTLPGDGPPLYGGPGQVPPEGTPPADPNNPGEWTYQQWLDWLNSLPDLPPALPPPGGTGTGGGSGADPTDELLDRLLASIEDLRRTLENYQDFLASLERGPLSGATLQQQFGSAQADFMAMLAAAQGGDMQAIRDLPGMAEEFLSIAAQYLDPASAEYQRILAMIQSSMGGIAGGLGDIINAAPESALGSNGVLDTIQEILAAMASRWGVDPGWNTGNLISGGFDWHPDTSSTSHSLAGGNSGGTSGHTPSMQTERVVAILTSIDRRLGTGNDLVDGQTTTLRREIGKLSEQQRGQMGYAGPVRGSLR